MTRASSYLLVLLLTTFAACSKKADPEPVVGDIELTLTYPSNYASLSYYLYTEAGFTSAPRIDPLRVGHLAPSIIIRDLNPGNYVFTPMGITPQSVQVTAGRTTKYTISY